MRENTEVAQIRRRVRVAQDDRSSAGHLAPIATVRYSRNSPVGWYWLASAMDDGCEAYSGTAATELEAWRAIELVMTLEGLLPPVPTTTVVEVEA